jgi:hypothetical protein
VQTTFPKWDCFNRKTGNKVPNASSRSGSRRKQLSGYAVLIGEKQLADPGWRRLKCGDYAAAWS